MKSAAVTLGLMTLSVLCLLEWSVVSGTTQRDRLFRDIIQNYVKDVEPDNTVLKVLLQLIWTRHDATSGILFTNALEEMIWTDTRLAWDPKDYGGIQTIRLPCNRLWLPDFKLINSVEPVDVRDNVNVRVTSGGIVIWNPPVLFQTPCSRNSTGNGLTCQINLGSWTYDSDTVKLELTGSGVSLEIYQNSTCPLAVDSAMAVIRTKHYSTESYSHVELNLQLKPKEV